MRLSGLLAFTAVVTIMAPSARLASGQCGAVFSYGDFSSLDGLTLVQEADTLANHLRLTRSGQGGAGAAWYTTSQAGLSSGFRTSFTFRIDGGTADGFAFVIQNAAPDALGDSGSGLGYAGITGSVAIEFDTFWFGGEFEGTHISVQTRGSGGNAATDDASLAHVVLPVPLGGASRQVTIEYTPGVLYVRLDGEPVLFCPLDLFSLDDGSPLYTDEGCAWVGFTGGAGAATADQVIESWTFTDWSDQECGSLTPEVFDGPGFTPETGDRIVFTASVEGPGPRTYRWRLNDNERLDDHRILGAASEIMVIDPFVPGDAGDYSFDSGNDCGGFGIGTIEVRIACPGDLNYDGLVDDADFLEFLPAYNALLVPEADKRCDWNGDRLVDDEDFVLFLPYYDQLICD